MPKLTPEQKERQREGLRRYNANRTPEEVEAHRERMRRVHANRSPEEKAALAEKSYAAYRRSRILKSPPKRGRLTSFGMLFEDDDFI